MSDGERIEPPMKSDAWRAQYEGPSGRIRWAVESSSWDGMIVERSDARAMLDELDGLRDRIDLIRREFTKRHGVEWSDLARAVYEEDGDDETPNGE